MKTRVRLGIMMFLQYAIWGSWAPVLSEYLMKARPLGLGLTGTQVGLIYSLLPLATILSPFIGGQVADRIFASQKVIGSLQLLGGIFLVILSRITDYTALLGLMLVYCLLYAPTLALTNSVAFINLENSEKDFGKVRVWGTIGWIAAGLLLSGWRFLGRSVPAIQIGGDTLLLAGIFSLLMGIQAFTLPNTPPKKKTNKPWAFLEALGMLKDARFSIFIFISFVVATELMFYYILTAPFLTSSQIGVSSTAISGVMVIAQTAEIFILAFLLPYFLPKYGIRKTMTIGILAWPLRYLIFAIGSPSWLVIASLSLHGFCFVFFFAAAFIYVDTIAPRDIRHSAQSLITLVTYGLGNYIGSLFAGWIQSYYTRSGVTDWRSVFIVPAVLTVLCAVAFMLFFKEQKTSKPKKA